MRLRLRLHLHPSSPACLGPLAFTGILHPGEIRRYFFIRWVLTCTWYSAEPHSYNNWLTQLDLPQRPSSHCLIASCAQTLLAHLLREKKRYTVYANQVQPVL